VGVFSGPRIGDTTAGSTTDLERILHGGPGVDMQQLREFFGISSWTDLIPVRPGLAGNTLPTVTEDRALRNAAVWSCLRLRADIISTLPVKVTRTAQVAGIPVSFDVATPPMLVFPGGEKVGIQEWLYSSQIDLDRVGNSIGIITERNGLGLPARIDLQLTQTCKAQMKNNVITSYRIGPKVYDPADIWHEKQFTVAGLPVGLSPVAYAAVVLGRHVSIETFAQGWFQGGAVPRARLRNTMKKVAPAEATRVKEAWRAAVAIGEPFVHGADWEYDFIQAAEASADWLEAQRAGVLDVCRFFGCPADMIDAEVNSGTRITYANVTQRHLQFLVTHLRSAIRRREFALSQWTQAPRQVCLDADDLLSMDPSTRATYLKTLIDGRMLAPDEGRAFEGRPPFTPAQIDQLNMFFPPKTAPVAAGPPKPQPPEQQPSGDEGQDQ
jgi:HK97 family phage portal protein